jgi:hypothetical protein
VKVLVIEDDEEMAPYIVSRLIEKAFLVRRWPSEEIDEIKEPFRYSFMSAFGAVLYSE